MDYIQGYSISQGGMYFADKSGGTLFTKDGVRMIMLNSSFPLPNDLVASEAVPGKGRTMSPVSLEGGYEADFDGVTYQVDMRHLPGVTRLTMLQGTKILSWASCCTP